jgi:hypothetical protein
VSFCLGPTPVGGTLSAMPLCAFWAHRNVRLSSKDLEAIQKQALAGGCRTRG